MKTRVSKRGEKTKRRCYVEREAIGGRDSELCIVKDPSGLSMETRWMSMTNRRGSYSEEELVGPSKRGR